jgi:multidrug efflux pump
VAENRLSYTRLFADVAGVVTARGPEPGEVVSAGRMVVQVAREGARDAVFDVPAQVKDSAPRNSDITVALVSDPNVTAAGKVREVSPRADPVTGTFAVRVQLIDPPPAMRLGSTVTGRVKLDTAPMIQIPAAALMRAEGGSAVWVYDPAAGTVAARSITVAGSNEAAVQVASGPEPGRHRGHRRRAGAASRAEGPPARDAAAVIGPNLSEWALRKRSLVIFLMILGVIAGASSFMGLGRGEDPAFTFRTMVVAAAWPGATVDETMEQVTERLERKLQETDYLDRVRSYTIAGQTTIFVDLKQSTPPAKVPDIWYQVRKNIGDIRGTLPQGVVGPFFNDDFGSTFGIIYAFTADGFSFRELRDHVEEIRSRLLHVPDVSEIEVLGAQDEQISLEFSTERLAGLRLDMGAVLATLQAQNVVRPAGTMQGERERVFLRVTGAFDSAADIEAVNLVVGGRIFRLGDIATVRRGYIDPPQPMFRVNGQPAIGLAIAMRDAGDILALGENIRSEMADIKADLPVGIEPTLVADQAVTVDTAINEFLTSLWQAIVIILACSFVSLGMRPGTVVALAIPLTLAIVFAVMDVANIDLHRISLGALIIALGLLVDDAMTTVDAMLRRLGAGDTKDQAATFAYRTLAAPMLIGTLVTIASFVPIGFAKSSAGEYTFSIFSVVGISLIVSWLVAVIFAPLLGKLILKPPKVAADPKPSRIEQAYGFLLKGAIGKPG